MTVQSMVTIVAPVARDKVEGLRKRVGDTLANPASETFREGSFDSGRAPKPAICRPRWRRSASATAIAMTATDSAE